MSGSPRNLAVRHHMANYCSTNCNLLTVNIIYSHKVADLLLFTVSFVAFNCRNYRKLTRKIIFFLETETKLLYFHFINHCHTVCIYSKMYSCLEEEFMYFITCIMQANIHINVIQPHGQWQSFVGVLTLSC